MAQGLSEQAVPRLLGNPLEQHVAQLEQFEAFVLGKRWAASEAQSHAEGESVTQTQDELRHEQAWSEALNRTAEILSARPHQPRPIRMDPPKFDGTAAHTIVHWLLAVEHCGVAQLIDDDSRMVSFAMSHLRGKASEWACLSPLADAKAFPP